MVAKEIAVDVEGGCWIADVIGSGVPVEGTLERRERADIGYYYAAACPQFPDVKRALARTPEEAVERLLEKLD